MELRLLQGKGLVDDDVDVNDAERIGVNSVFVAMVERRNSLLVIVVSLLVVV